MTPRWLSPEAAAAHVDLRVDYFLRRVRAGHFPAPSLHLGPRNPRWDREALDAAMGQAPASAAAAAQENANAAVEEMFEAARRKAEARGRNGQGLHVPPKGQSRRSAAAG